MLTNPTGEDRTRETFGLASGQDFSEPPSNAPEVREPFAPASGKDFSQGADVEKRPDYGMSGWMNSNKIRKFDDFLVRAFADKPEVGQAAENLIIEYPSISRDLLAGLAVSGQLGADSAILAELVEMDEAAQAAKSSNPIYGAAKQASRGIMIVAEDLYNNTPYMALARRQILQFQGASIEEIERKSRASNAVTSVRMQKLGFDRDYGEGFLPGRDIVGQGDTDWLLIKEMLLDGTFDGSAEEKIIAAQQRARIERGIANGMNPNFFTVNTWEATKLNRSINGVNFSVSYSPGALGAYRFTTPGTRSYNAFSGAIDTGFRMYMEPVDVVFDNVGDMLLAKVNPKVVADSIPFGVKGQSTLRKVVAKYLDLDLVDDITAVPTRNLDEMGNPIAQGQVKGVTPGDVDKAGRARPQVDPSATQRHFDQRVETMRRGDGDAWENPDDVYTAFYADQGMSPNDVLDELNKHGGDNAETFLTIEHENVHNTRNPELFEVDTMVRENGETYRILDKEKPKAGAPEEIVTQSRRYADEKATMVDIEEVRAGYDTAAARADDARRKVASLESQVKNAPAGEKKGLFRDLDQARKAHDSAVRSAKVADEKLYATMVRRADIDQSISSITEYETIQKAWANMMDGSWKAPTIMRKYKRAAGLSSIIRPFTSPKMFFEWINSAVGKRTMSALARTDDIEKLRKMAPGLDLEDIRKIANTTNEGTIAAIYKAAFDEGTMGIQKPSVARVRSKITQGMDAWEGSQSFTGGSIAGAARRQGRRLGASTGNNILDITDPEGMLDTIASQLNTAKVDPKEVNKLQEYAIKFGNTQTGLGHIESEIRRLTTERIVKLGGGEYTVADVDAMWDEWNQAQIDNKIYWMSRGGKQRNWIWHNSKYKSLSDLEKAGVEPEAFMEAQFAVTTKVMPDIRRFRRLTSRQRTALEKVRKRINAYGGSDEVWTPLGFNSSLALRAGDAGFGVWRDFQLARAGWAVRIITEEQVRFGASGYAGLFSNPLDYLISVMNDLDFVVDGDDITLGDYLRQQEALGAGGLRDPGKPLHTVKANDWKAARRDKPQEVKFFWGGMTREYVTASSDYVMNLVARVGAEEARRILLTTDEGKEVVRRIATDASKESSLGKIANTKELEKYVQVVELRIAEMTGGRGLWRSTDPGELFGKMVDEYGIERYKPASELTKDELLGELVDTGGTSRKNKAELEAMVNEQRGFNLDELNESEAAAVMIAEGNEDLVKLIGDKQLDGINISDEMPYDELRAIDAQLEEAFGMREVEPPDSIPVAAGEMDRPLGKGLYNRATDRLFELLNGIPSQVLNRQPFFQQAMGHKIAQAYFYGDTELRAAIDEMRSANQSFDIMMSLGDSKILKDMGLRKYPKAFPSLGDEAAGLGSKAPDPDAGLFDTTVFDDPNVPPSVYDDAIDAGSYERIPLQGDGSEWATPVLMEYLEYNGVREAAATKPRGIHTLRNPNMDVDYATYPGVVFSGTGKGGRGRRVGREPAAKFLIDEPNTPLRYLNGDFPEDPIEADKLLREWMLDASDEEVAALAKQSGWDKEVARSSGIARQPGRATGIGDDPGKYGDYVDVMISDHLEPALQEQLVAQGDIEQMMSIEGRYPELDKLGGVPAGYNAVRARTGFIHSPIGDRDLLTSMYPGEESIDDYFNLMDDLASTVDGLGDGEAMEAAVYWWVGKFRGDTGKNNVMTMREAASFLDSSNRPLDRRHTQLWMGDDPGAIVGPEFEQELTYLVDYTRAKPLQVTNRRAEVMMDEDIEFLIWKSIGVDPTDAQRAEMDDILGRRSYQPDETVLADTGIKPAARLHRKTVDKLVKHGMMVENNRQLGDAAMLIDQNLQRAPSVEADYGLSKYFPNHQSAEGVASQYAVAGRESPFTTRRQAEIGNIDAADVARIDEEMEVLHAHMLEEAVYTKKLEGNAYVDITQGSDGSYVADLKVNIPAYISIPAYRSWTNALDEVFAFYPADVKDTMKWYQDAPSGVRERLKRGGEVFEEYAQTYVMLETMIQLLEQGPDFAGRLERGALKGDAAFKEEFYVLVEQTSNPRHVPGLISDQITKQLDRLSERRALMEAGARQYGGPLMDVDPSGYKLGNYRLKDDIDSMADLKTDFTATPQAERNAAVQRVFPGIDDGQNYDWMETGGFSNFPKSQPSAVEQLEQVMKAAKFDAIADTKFLFYDLAGKSNVADAMKFIFPFGDAFSEVVSRWGVLMNPARSGGQSLRNVRRVQNTSNAAKQSGFVETNEYGEEVFNWPLAPGMIANFFIPNSSNVGLQGSMPVSSLMFIDPSARGIMLPGIGPGVQFGVELMRPVTENIPLFDDALQWLTYGAKDEYRPGPITNMGDVITPLLPTVMRRLAAAVFQQDNIEQLGNTKLRLFESFLVSGDPTYDPTDPQAVIKAWDTANTTGSWLGWLRVFDSWFLPGQPQYAGKFETDPTMDYQELLDETAKLDAVQQAPIISLLRMQAEYRNARELFGEAEADMYMIERYGVLPAVLQSTSTPLMDSPVSFGGVQWVADNEWLKDAAPYTLVGTIPHDADDSFSTAAWNKQYSDIVEIGGLPAGPNRVRRSPSEISDVIERSLGYDQLNYTQEVYDDKIEKLRAYYGESYASNELYRAQKRELDETLKLNKGVIYSEFGIVHPNQQGKIVGSRQGITNRQLMDEVRDIGQKGTSANKQFNENLPSLAAVAEQYADWFDELERVSLQISPDSSADWWAGSTSEKGIAAKAWLVRQINGFYGDLEDPNAKVYAKWINDNIMNQLIDDWEWIDRAFSPELKVYPSIQYKSDNVDFQGALTNG